MILLFLYGSDTLILCIDASSFHCLIVCTLWWLQESETGRCCAQLVKPVNYGEISSRILLLHSF